jgi:hypothetical protein
MSNKPKCACPSHDAYSCWQIRYPVLDCIGEEDRSIQRYIDDEGGPCECACHHDYEDEENWIEPFDMGAQ